MLHTQPKRNGFKQKFAALLIAAMVLAPTQTAFASTWGPTLLVNTEAFQIIDDGDGASDIELRFGDSLDERLKWSFVNTRFQFTDDVHVEGNLTASGTISVDGAADFDSTINVAGAAIFGSTISLGGVVYTFPGADGGNTQVLTTDSAGNLSWTEKSAGSLTQNAGDNRYVEKSGDTMTGNLVISNGALLTVSGAIITEGNITLNDDNGAADAVLTFGNDAGDETFQFNDTTNEFDLSDDLNVTGSFDATSNITTNADLTINADNGGADAVLTFGNDAGAETLQFNDTTNEFDLSDDLNITGTLDTTGNITTDANLTINEDNGGVDAVLSFGNDSGVETITFDEINAQFEVSDDLIVSGNLAASGTLIVDGATDLDSTLKVAGAATLESTLDTVGDITTDANLTINEDSGAADAVLTFGSDTVDETLKFLNAADRFEFSDDLHVTGNITATGTLSVDGAADFDSTINVAGAAVFGSTVSLGGVVYTFPGSDGSAGEFLQTDGAGTVSWSAQSNTSGSILFLSPTYANSVYTGTGVGTLTNQYDATNFENHYRWQTSQSVSEPYSIVIQVRIPDNFASWDSGSGAIQLRYRTSATSSITDNINVTLRDTAGANVALTGGSDLTSATAAAWNTAIITGPESSGTYTAGDFITVTLDMEAASASAYADAGWLEFNWDTTIP